MSSMRRPGVPATAVAASPIPADKIIKSRFSDQSLERKKSKTGAYKASQRLDLKKDSVRVSGGYDAHTPIINISVKNNNIAPPSATISAVVNNTDAALADELDYITVTTPNISNPESPTSVRPDKAARILGIRHRKSMEPIPASTRNSIMSTRSLRDATPLASFVPTLPLTSLYVVSGLPKSPHTWTLADPDSVLG